MERSLNDWFNLSGTVMKLCLETEQNMWARCLFLCLVHSYFWEGGKPEFLQAKTKLFDLTIPALEHLTPIWLCNNSQKLLALPKLYSLPLFPNSLSSIYYIFLAQITGLHAVENICFLIEHGAEVELCWLCIFCLLKISPKQLSDCGLCQENTTEQF